MNAPTVTIGSEHALTLTELYRRAATHKGLSLSASTSQISSEPIREYDLDQSLLAVLSERGIKRHDRPDCGKGFYSLVDENPQKSAPGYMVSNGWHCELVVGSKCKFNLRITLSAGLCINFMKRGIVFVPQARGPSTSPSDLLPNFRMFRVLIENDPDAPAVAKELAASDGTITVTWSELGLGGIRRLSELFMEFAMGNKAVMELGRNGSVFDPVPYPHHQRDCDELFIPELAQPDIFETWRAQLRRYRSCLVL